MDYAGSYRTEDDALAAAAGLLNLPVDAIKSIYGDNRNLVLRELSSGELAICMIGDGRGFAITRRTGGEPYSVRIVNDKQGK